MAYTDHFRTSDDLIVHLDTVISSLKDPFLESRYTGFLAVSCVTVLELALKNIFMERAHAKHIVLGNFCRQYFDRINGRIMLNDIKGDYLGKFGTKYCKRFTERLEDIEKTALSSHQGSVKSSYGNLIVWRHSFAHEGVIPQNANYAGVKKGYQCGKIVMACLESCLHR